MVRFVGCVAVVLLCGAAPLVDINDPVREKLFVAKRAFDAERKSVHKQTEEWFETREDAARKANDQKALEQIQTQRVAFEDSGELPKNVPAAIKARQDRALKVLEAAYTQAAKEYTATKKVTEAAAVESELRNIRSRLHGIDLLALIDPKAHAVLGTWKREGDSIVGVNPRFPGVLQLPYVPGEEYDLEVTARRLSGEEYFGFQVVAGGKRLGISIDTWPSKGYLSGMGAINGKSLLDNGTEVKGQFIKNNRDFTVRCSVRGGKIDVSVDGKLIISYKGEFNGFSIHSDFRVPNEKALALQIGYTSPFQIDRLVVTPVKGAGTVLK